MECKDGTALGSARLNETGFVRKQMPITRRGALGAAAARHIIEGAPADPLTLAHRVVPRGSTAPR